MDYLGNSALTQIPTNLRTLFGSNKPFVRIYDLLLQIVKNESKNKNVFHALL